MVEKEKTHPEQTKILDEVAALQDVPERSAGLGHGIRSSEDSGNVNGDSHHNQEGTQRERGSANMPTKKNKAPPAYEPEAAGSRYQSRKGYPGRHNLSNERVSKKMLAAESNEDTAKEEAKEELGYIRIELHEHPNDECPVTSGTTDNDTVAVVGHGE